MSKNKSQSQSEKMHSVNKPKVVQDNDLVLQKIVEHSGICPSHWKQNELAFSNWNIVFPFVIYRVSASIFCALKAETEKETCDFW